MFIIISMYLLMKFFSNSYITIWLLFIFYVLKDSKNLLPLQFEKVSESSR